MGEERDWGEERDRWGIGRDKIEGREERGERGGEGRGIEGRRA